VVGAGLLIEPPPRATLETCQVKSRRNVTIDQNDWRVDETLGLTGYYAAWMLSAFTGLSAQEQREKAQEILAKQGATQIHEFVFQNLEEIGEPARLTMRYTVRDGVSISGNRSTGVLPALWERDYRSRSVLARRLLFFAPRACWRKEEDIDKPDGRRCTTK